VCGVFAHGGPCPHGCQNFVIRLNDRNARFRPSQNLFQRRQLLHSGKSFDIPGEEQRLFMLDLPALDVSGKDSVQPPGCLKPKAAWIEASFSPQT
jgi:hypothetical protein